MITKKILSVKKAVAKTIGDGLPTRPTVGTSNPLGLVWLLIAPPGWGKTEFLMSFPDCLLLACEEGHKLVKGFKIVIDCYKSSKVPTVDTEGNQHMSMLQAVELIKKSKRFKFIIIDTIDALVKMIVDYFVDSKKVEHIEDIGKWGRGYDVAQNAPFRRVINDIVKSGRGVGLITHQQVVEKAFKSGTRAKKETTLPSGITKIIIPQVDIAMHGEFGKKRKPNRKRDRICVTEGSEETLAKNRGGMLPSKFLLPHKFEERFPLIESFFKDKSNIAKAEDAYDKIYAV